MLRGSRARRGFRKAARGAQRDVHQIEISQAPIASLPDLEQIESITSNDTEFLPESQGRGEN
jgi:hypothetical protein